MSDKMRIIPFHQLLFRIFSELRNSNEIFGLSNKLFYQEKNNNTLQLLSGSIATPIGPAAGPHTQLAQNIITAYLSGGRFIELKTVQKLDKLEIDKPCIDARDEGYNIEWSQELLLDHSFDEYVKAWFIIHILNGLLELSPEVSGNFIFNMSVGYDLAGIKTDRMNRFIDELKDASRTAEFNKYLKEVNILFNDDLFLDLLRGCGIKDENIRKTTEALQKISPHLSRSVTLSTMHGCPPDEIEAIGKYLMKEKKLHTYIKLNPTLLGYSTVRKILDDLHYDRIVLDKHAFDNDLQYNVAVPMLKRLKTYAADLNLQFGVKLSNTLGVKNNDDTLAGNEKYMSGRALFPLTVNLSAKLAEEFAGDIKISYSGGANQNNIKKLFATGIYPITVATDLLKPGGYGRLYAMAAKLSDTKFSENDSALLNVTELRKLADESLTDDAYRQDKRKNGTVKTDIPLQKFDCFMAPCEAACPIHQDVSAYIGLVEEGRYAEAFEVITAKNPLPHITAYICDHQCMTQCTRHDYDTPVAIRDMKKEAVLNGYGPFVEKFKSTFSPDKNGIKVAVIGAGPSGLAAAYFLLLQGFSVTVFDKERRAGGTVQHIIPDFRLPQSAIDRDIEFMENLGIEFRFSANENFSVSALKDEGYRYIHIAIGAGKSQTLNLEQGSDKVLAGVSFLRDFNRDKDALNLGKTVAVIGGGNSAMDSARAAKRVKGVEKVMIIYRRTVDAMPADREELEAALADGIEFKELLQPLSFTDSRLKCQKMEPGNPGADGRITVFPVPDAFETVRVDTVISAIGEQVDKELLTANKISLNDTTKTSNPDVTTSIKNVFIGGDALRGPSTVVESLADGKRAAELICREEGLRFTQPDFKKLFDIEHKEETLAERKIKVWNAKPSTGIQEAARCLNCSLLCNKCIDVCPNRANVKIKTEGEYFKDPYQILHIDSMCNECGNCETFCPHDGAPYKDKTTLFSLHEDFVNSTNDGFLLDKINNGKYYFSIRYEGKEGKFSYDPTNGDFTFDITPSGENFTKFTAMITAVVDNYGYLL